MYSILALVGVCAQQASHAHCRMFAVKSTLTLIISVCIRKTARELGNQHRLFCCSVFEVRLIVLADLADDPCSADVACYLRVLSARAVWNVDSVGSQGRALSCCCAG